MWSMGLISRTAMSTAIRASSHRTLMLGGGGGLRSFTVKTSPENEVETKEITMAEAKKLMRLVNVEDMKKKLVGMSERYVVPLVHFLKLLKEWVSLDLPTKLTSR